jgi:hypothetical protein
MTRKRIDGHSTEFGLWLRDQKTLDQRLGYLTTNLDYIWGNYNKQKWMLIEEKRYGSALRQAQMDMIELVDNCCKADPRYKGFHFLQFQNTSPEDGAIFWNGVQISKDELLKKLAFEENE